MIDKNKIIRLTEQVLEEDLFLIGAEVKNGNSIVVTVDGDNGITIERCIAISRHIERNLDREEDDFDLQVTSPGLDMPFKVHRQFIKNRGKNIVVVTQDDKKLTGVLHEVTDQDFEMRISQREHVEGKKKKQWIAKSYRFGYEDVKSVKNVISFK